MVINPTSSHEDTGSIPGITQWVKGAGGAVTCGVGCRSDIAVTVVQASSCSSDSTLAELAYAVGMALKRQKKKLKLKLKHKMK